MKKTFAYDFEKGDFVTDGGNPVTVSDEEALKVWINKILHTQLGRYAIYNGTSYGANIEDLVIGNVYGIGFTQSELRREIETALLQNSDIKSISAFNMSREKEKLTVTMTLKTTYGEEKYTYDG